MTIPKNIVFRAGCLLGLFFVLGGCIASSPRTPCPNNPVPMMLEATPR